MSFWNKNNENSSKNTSNSDEYGNIFRRLTEIASELELCKTQIKVLQTDVDNLRGNFNRRLKGIKEVEETKDINIDGSVYLG